MHNNPLSTTIIGRRSLLTTVGLCTLASMVPTSIAAARPPLRIGLLLPQSQRYPTLSTSLVAGIRLAALQLGDQVAGRGLDFPIAWYAARPAQGVAALHKLLVEEHVDAVIGLASSVSAGQLQRILSERRVPMLLSDVGANLLRGTVTSPYLYRSSLAAWQSSAAAGAWAAKGLGRRAAIITSFYEAGYDMPAAFRLGFEQAGGQISGTYVTNTPDGKGDLSTALQLAAAERPDLIYALYSGKQADAFAQAFSQSPLYGQIPLIGGALTLESVSPALQPALVGAYSVSPWADDDRLAGASHLRQALGSAADPIALLGHDAAALMFAGLQATDGRAELLAEALPGSQIGGARGHIVLHATAHEAEGPLYLRQAVMGGGQLSHRLRANLPQPADSVVQALAAGPKTGWSNAYLCV